MGNRQYFPSRQRLSNDTPDQHRSLLLDLITNTLNDHLLAGQKITMAALCRYINALCYAWIPKQMEDYAPFNEISRLAHERTTACELAWQASDPKEHWDVTHTPYLDPRQNNTPEVEPNNRVGRFVEEYLDNIDQGVRIITDPALYGLFFIALNDPDFAALCKNKDIDTSSMTFEQKMHEELDHEALYRYLQGKLGVA